MLYRHCVVQTVLYRQCCTDTVLYRQSSSGSKKYDTICSAGVFKTKLYNCSKCLPLYLKPNKVVQLVFYRQCCAVDSTVQVKQYLPELSNGFRSDGSLGLRIAGRRGCWAPPHKPRADGREKGENQG